MQAEQVIRIGPHCGGAEAGLLLETYSGSSYFKREADAPDGDALVRRLRGNAIALAIEIPPNFGADLRRGRAPEVSVWIDGGMPFRAETIEGYVNGAHASFLAELARQQGISVSRPASLVMRYRYNQAFRSIDAMVPALFAMMLMLIPAILATLGVVSGMAYVRLDASAAWPSWLDSDLTAKVATQAAQ